MGILRSKETHDQYMKLIEEGFLSQGCNLCHAPSIIEFDYWRVIDNKFPYDLLAETHHMVVSKRCVVESELNPQETQELKILKSGYLNQKYEFILEALDKNKTIPGHFHLHLIVAKTIF